MAPAEGTLPGALKIEVKDADGGYLATLQTGLQPQPAAACADDAAKPYVVVSSVPVELPHRGGEGTIDPRVVFRVIQGYKYFGSYGITNVVGGTEGKSCALQNLVRGPEGKGDYSFGDLTELKAFAPDQKVAPAKAFDTLGPGSQLRQRRLGIRQRPADANVSEDQKLVPHRPHRRTQPDRRRRRRHHQPLPHTPEIHAALCSRPPGLQDRGRHQGRPGRVRGSKPRLQQLRGVVVRDGRRRGCPAHRALRPPRRALPLHGIRRTHRGARGVRGRPSPGSRCRRNPG